tara:strand:- start:406 stop:861 length:456 start_codon:yes stop_codon:yes gene_type:complete
MNRVNYHDRQSANFFKCSLTGELLRFTEHYTWNVVGSLTDFPCDEDTECPVFKSGEAVRGYYLSDEMGQREQFNKLSKPTRPTKAEINGNACDYAEKQLLELVQALSTDRAVKHGDPTFPHDYVADIMGKLNGIRKDLRTREGTPGFGKLK